MNRLGTRLVLAMMAVVVVALTTFTVFQVVTAVRVFHALPQDVRERVQRRPFLAPPPRLERPAGMMEETLEQRRFLALFERFRTVQRDATLLSIAIATVLGVLLAWWLSRTIAKPIEEVSAAAARVAQGDLDVRVNTKGNSETAELARNFNQMAVSLENYELERKAMIADIAHELRTPLTAMQGRLEAIIDGLLPFEAGEAERLHRQTELLSRLVNDLRILSLADAGKLSLRKQDVDLKTLLRESVAEYADRATNKGVKLELDLPEAASLSASIDPDRMAQVLGNLLDNALRVTPSNGWIRVGLSREADELRLSVADTGPGLSAEAKQHAFDRFYQERDSKGGSGLGLAIVKMLVELHGGSVSAENHAQGGAQFEISLPLG